MTARSMASGFLLVAALLTASGCAKIHSEQNFDLSPRAHKGFHVDPSKKERKASVTVKASGGKANVYIMLTKDWESAQSILESGRSKDLEKGPMLGKVEDVEDGTATATIPANEGWTYAVYNPGNKKIDVTVKMQAE